MAAADIDDTIALSENAFAFRFKMKHLNELAFQKLYTFLKSAKMSSWNLNRNTTPNQHIYTICGWPVVAGRHFWSKWKYYWGLHGENFEAASSSSFEDNKKE